MSSVLVVPMHADALVLPQARLVAPPSADFERLPYALKDHDVNPDVAYLSQSLVTPPFEDERLNLRAGVHIHWSLPDALTRGIPQGDRSIFPEVPNRWLVRRSPRNGEGVRVWIVESDYLLPEGQPNLGGGVAVPNPNEASPYPFRFLGRQLDFETWQRLGGEEAARLPSLTAVGYGEPAFAAYYPNCHSVFGFLDPTPEALKGEFRYDIVGWYDDPAKDALAVFRTGFVEDLLAAWERLRQTIGGLRQVVGKMPETVARAIREELSRLKVDVDEETARLVAPFVLNFEALHPFADQARAFDEELAKSLIDALEGQHRWTLAAPAAFPNRILCATRLVVDAPSVIESEQNAFRNASAEEGEHLVTVGNTSTEALSAYLAMRFSHGDEEKKLQLEDQLEAILMGTTLSGEAQDLGACFDALRHEGTFRPSEGGTVWTVRREPKAGVAASDAVDEAQVPLPVEIAHEINALNLAQLSYDRLTYEIDSRRRRLFGDWYKYMLCAYPPEGARADYPDVDAVRDFIERRDLAPLETSLERLGTLEVRTLADDDLTDRLSGEVVDVSYGTGGIHSTKARRVAVLAQRLLRRLAKLNEKKPGNSHYVLKQSPAPRFFGPTDPVVLLTGPLIQPSDRHGEDGRLHEKGYLDCVCLEEVSLARATLLDGLAAVFTWADSLANGPESIGYRRQAEAVWHPFMFEWEAEAYPLALSSNLDAERTAYEPDHITANYDLRVDSPALTLRANVPYVRAANVYTGSGILTADASLPLRDRLTKHLIEFREDYEVPEDLTTRLGKLLSESPQKKGTMEPSKKVTDLAGWFADILELLEDPCFGFLAQSLGGFNDALVMRRHALQLPIDDPLAFGGSGDSDSYRAFARRVAEGVKDANEGAPLPLNDFNPIRTGAMRITRLRLVDTFGRFRDLDCTDVRTTASMTLPGQAGWVGLQPRFTQPARLRFRWLAGDGDVPEMNDHPATSPICGWIVPNELDDSLMVYDAEGIALGEITDEGGWEAPPGDPEGRPDRPEAIPNDALRQVVSTLTAHATEERFVDAFHSAVQEALRRIDPASNLQHPETALLMGRPLAVVRATIDLELRGLPENHQGWNVFRQELIRARRQTDGVENVEVPIRLGEHSRLGDGLVGFWREESDGTFADGVFRTHTADEGGPLEPHPLVGTADVALVQTARLLPNTFTMLIDPRGAIHATCGVLPTQALRIPPEQYVQALGKIQISFLTAPILTDDDRIRLPLPIDPGYAWSWVSRDERGWSSVEQADIAPPNYLAVFDHPRELREGWLVLRPTEEPAENASRNSFPIP